MKDYELDVKDYGNTPTVNFANNTNRFVEVIFVVDGKNIKTGKALIGDERGYCYPDHYEMNIKKMARGIKIAKGSKIEAHIFEGDGNIKKEDYDVPVFIRRRLGEKITTENKKATFHRSNNSSIVLNYAI
jgi:hypothetical protein